MSISRATRPKCPLRRKIATHRMDSDAGRCGCRADIQPSNRGRTRPATAERIVTASVAKDAIRLSIRCGWHPRARVSIALHARQELGQRRH
jgi:hypothetical protein